MPKMERLRHLKIMELASVSSFVQVADLAERFDVSESTIRRDLTDLEETGFVRRVHGGAFIEAQPDIEPPFELRQVSHQEEKDLVGRAAAQLVQDGETIFIDGGTTTPFIVPHLQHRQNLTVLTIGLNVATALARNPNISTLLVGGELHIESQAFTGPLTLKAFRMFELYCDWAFISAGGVSAGSGVTNRILDRIPIKREAIEISRKVAVVVDGSKIGVGSGGWVIPMERVDLLFTDNSAEKDELDMIRALGVDVIMAD